MAQPYMFAACSTIDCPRRRNIDLPVDMPKSEMLRDSSGFYWCPDCEKRCELMNYGKGHKWPDVHAAGRRARYATGDGSQNWKISILAGNQDSIDAFYAELIENETQQ